jgi:AmmeMemoRadiSam system protein A
MALMPFTELDDDDKKILRQLAQDSIHYGLQHHKPLPLNLGDYNQHLARPGASFVTLNLNHQLRGCIGALEAYQPLVKDVVDHAFAAAFNDPRFPPVTTDEAAHLELHISVLSKPTPIEFSDEDDLLTKIEPGVDGLILEDNFHKGTFLPSVWEQLTTPREFLDHLKLKAGLKPHDWNEDIRVYRYHTTSF